MSAENVAASVLAGLSDNKQTTGKGSPSGAPRQDEKEASSAARGTKKKLGRRPKKPAPKFAVDPRVVQIVKKPKTYMDHSYRDFSAVPPEIGHEEPTEIEDMTFSQKVHQILSQEKYSGMICWMPHGRAFKILVPKMLENGGVLKKYFGHNRFSSFLRQLNNHGFKHISQGRDRNTYYHEFMLRALPHLSKYMPEPKDARRLLPDPENEPDFYNISSLFPVPDDATSAKLKKNPAPEKPADVGAKRPSEAVWTETAAPPAKAAKTTVEASPQAMNFRSAPSTSWSMPPVSNAPSALDLAQVRAAITERKAELLSAAALQAQLELRAQLFAQQQVQQHAQQYFKQGSVGLEGSNATALAELLRLNGGAKF